MNLDASNSDLITNCDKSVGCPSFGDPDNSAFIIAT